MKSWRVFRAAAIMTGRFSSSSLDLYARGITELMTYFNDWAVISQADEAIRSEEWALAEERYSQCPPSGYAPKEPWEFILRASAWNSPTWDPHFQRFWRIRVELPVQRMGKDAARQVVQLEGALTNAFSLASEPSSSSMGGFLRPTPKTKPDRGGVICFNCDGDHNLAVCPYPIDEARVMKAREEFRKRKSLGNPEPPKKRLKAPKKGNTNDR